MGLTDSSFIKEHLSAIGISPDSFSLTPVGGGSINRCYKVRSGKQVFFCKINSAQAFPRLFECEANGLREIAKSGVIKTPEVLHVKCDGELQLLLLEFIEPQTSGDSFWRKFGEQLAALHSIKGPSFGFCESNYMGSLPQSNSRSNDWNIFFINERLKPQVELAVKNNLLQPGHIERFERLFTKIDTVFETEPPCLVHGDLWNGNFLCSQSEPYLIDPAVYYGNRHIDLAMTTLFGGFERSFYEAYSYHYPLSSKQKEVWDVCNLYPLLVHLNLFGKSYLTAILSVINRF